MHVCFSFVFYYTFFSPSNIFICLRFHGYHVNVCSNSVAAAAFGFDNVRRCCTMCRQRYGYNPNILKRCLKSTLNLRSKKKKNGDRGAREEKSPHTRGKFFIFIYLYLLFLWLIGVARIVCESMCDAWLVGRNVNVTWIDSNWLLDDVWSTFHAGYPRYFWYIHSMELMFVFKNECSPPVQSTCLINFTHAIKPVQ